MYRVWYSTQSFADYIVDHTLLAETDVLVMNKMYESDANNPDNFHRMPDHIRKILYLDACDLIVEKDNEPVFSIEVTTEAGTGHNAFQRFARLAASVENGVPAFYIYPEGAIITRQNSRPRWDKINPLVFRALEEVMNIYQIPALLYYFPSDIAEYGANPELSPHFINKGLKYDENIARYAGCPDSNSVSMQNLFSAIDEVLRETQDNGVRQARENLLRRVAIRQQRIFMQEEYARKAGNRAADSMSPLTSVTRIPSEYLLNYLSQYETDDYSIGELLRSRARTCIYHVNARFRGDPYPGALAAIDYLKCRQGKTYEDRLDNLVLLFGQLEVDDDAQTIRVTDCNNSTIDDFFSSVKNCERNNLLTKDYADLRNKEIPRYLMQVRYGSTYSKVKHIRVFSYFADAILFPDGSLWRDA